MLRHRETASPAQAAIPGAPIAPRARLIALRTELAAAIMAGDRIEPGFLAMLAHADAAIGVLDRLPVDDAKPAARVVVADDGQVMRLAFYTQDGEAVAVTLDPQRALALAGDLLDAARRRLR